MDPKIYNMDQVQAMFYVAHSWLAIKSETINNCWKHTNLLKILSKEHSNDDSCDVSIPSHDLPLDEEVSAELNEMLPRLPGNIDNEIQDVSELDLDAGESDLMLFPPITVGALDQVSDEEVEDEAIEEELAPWEIAEQKRFLREGYESILKYETPTTQFQFEVHRYARSRLAEFRAEANNSKQQTDLRSFFN